MRGSMILMPFLGLFSFCLFASSNFNVFIFALFYSVLFCYGIVIS